MLTELSSNEIEVHYLGESLAKADLRFPATLLLCTCSHTKNRKYWSTLEGKTAVTFTKASVSLKLKQLP